MLKTLCTSLALALAGCGAAAAAPLAPGVTQPTPAAIVLVREGCGPRFHRGRYGECVPNGGREEFVEPRGPRVVAPVRLPPPCPRGYVRDPDPARPICYPRF